jgi:hypothetical protein
MRNRRYPNGEKSKLNCSYFHIAWSYPWKTPKYSTRQLLELRNKFNEDAGHKMNKQKLSSFLYISNQLCEEEISEKKLFNIHTEI